MNSSYAKQLKDFADKLTGENQLSEADIKKSMSKLGLVYSEDEIERLNRVLLALHPIAKNITEDKTSKKEISH